MSDLRKVTLKKDYGIRHDIIVESGAVIHIGEYRAIQLAKNGFIDFDGISEKKAIEKQMKKARIKKEEVPQTVIHKIEE